MEIATSLCRVCNLCSYSFDCLAFQQRNTSHLFELAYSHWQPCCEVCKQLDVIRDMYNRGFGHYLAWQVFLLKHKEHTVLLSRERVKKRMNSLPLSSFVTSCTLHYRETATYKSCLTLWNFSLYCYLNPILVICSALAQPSLPLPTHALLTTQIFTNRSPGSQSAHRIVISRVNT